MNRSLQSFALAAASTLALVSFGCDADVEDTGDVTLPTVTKTQEGNVDLPEVEVKGGDVDLPAYDSTGGNVRMPDVDVETADVDLTTEKKTITVPGIDVDMPGDGDADEINNK